MTTHEKQTELTGRHVLLVEDEPLLALEMASELEKMGALPIGPVLNVEEALAVVQSERAIDAAVLNVFLRRALSFPVANALAARGIPFLFVTGSDNYVREHFPEVPCHPKPADMWKVIQSLGMLLGDRNSA